MNGKLKDLTRNMDGTWNLTVTVNGDCRGIWDKYRPLADRLTQYDLLQEVV